MSDIRFITICHGLHNHGGHEYMYTKGICDSLPKNFSHEVWGRKDVIPEVEASLSVEPVFSKVDYNQEMNLLFKGWKLLERESKWFREIRARLKILSTTLRSDEKVVVFVHTFSIYNVWSWLFLVKYFQKNNIQLLLFFRYSSLLLPNGLKPLFYLLCSKLPKNDVIYLTDTEQLKSEYAATSQLDLRVMPVVAKTSFDKIEELSDSDDNTILLSYLGSARVDKGFQNLPSIVEKAYSMNLGSKIKFIIQASIPGVDYLESPCEIALLRLKELSSREGYDIQLILEHLSDGAYENLLEKSNLILLPYTGITYKVQSSGILVEAMAHGIPCIVPRGTWMESELSRTGGGVAFDSNDPSDVARSACSLLDNFSTYDSLAKKGAKEIKSHHGAPAQAAEIVKLISS